MYLIRFSKQADKDKKMLRGAGLDQKAKDILNIIASNPFQSPPPYEGLVGNLKGYYSRRINIQHRLVYQVYDNPIEFGENQYEGTIKVIRMWSHYKNIR